MAARTCAACSKVLTKTNPRARYCNSTCRANAAKRRAKGIPEVSLHVLTVAPPATDSNETDERGPVYAATLTELIDAERESTALGQAALALAARIDLGIDTGSSLASAVKTLGDTLAAATRGARRQETALDRVRRQRDEKRGA